MTKEEKTILNDLLIKFFEEQKFGSPNFLNRDTTAFLLKKHLFELGYWRNKARNKNPVRSIKMDSKQFAQKHQNQDCPF
jgi:hypothetical protein